MRASLQLSKFKPLDLSKGLTQNTCEVCDGLFILTAPGWARVPPEHPEAAASNLKESKVKVPTPAGKNTPYRHAVRLRYLHEIRGLIAALAVLIGAVTGLVVVLLR